MSRPCRPHPEATPSARPRPEPVASCCATAPAAPISPQGAHLAVGAQRTAAARLARTLAQPLVLSLALALLFVAAPAAHAEAPCGGLRVADGWVEFGAAQRLADVRGPAMEACLDAVAKELLTRPGLRSITVAARVGGDAKARLAAAESASYVADRLATRGIDRARISSVVPRAAPGELDSVRIAFLERRSFRPVAQVWSMGGKVLVGHALGSLVPALPGTVLSSQQYVETGVGSVAIVFLLDGSRLRLSPETVVRLGAVTFSSSAGRSVQLELLRGHAEVHGSKHRGPLRLVTGNAIAGVRGTYFRLALPEDRSTRLETTDGTVDFAGSRGQAFVTRGEGSRVDASGYPEAVRPLLLEPRIIAPVRGTRGVGDLLTWAPVPQAQAYRLEFAHTAQFDAGYWTLTTKRERALVSEAHTPGLWFWRVTAVDVDGFEGFSSKIYAFRVPGPAPTATP